MKVISYIARIWRKITKVAQFFNPESKLLGNKSGDNFQNSSLGFSPKNPILHNCALIKQIYEIYIPLRRRAPPLSPASGQPAAVIPAVIGWYFWASRPRRAKHKATHRSKLVNDTLEIKKCHQCNVCRSKTICILGWSDLSQILTQVSTQEHYWNPKVKDSSCKIDGFMAT